MTDEMMVRDFRQSTKTGREMTAYLDHLDYASVRELLGPPEAIHSTQRGDGPGWRQGQPVPALATADPAVVQAMARCLSRRTADPLPLPVGVKAMMGDIHPAPCAWCDFPPPEIRAAVDWAGWASSLIDVEYAEWCDSHGARYCRTTPRQGTYAHPAWSAFYANSPDRATAGRRRSAAIIAAMYDQGGTQQ